MAAGDKEAPLLIAAVDPVSLALLSPPGEYGADIAVGEGQQLGGYPSYGGPSFGFFAARQVHVRKIPGRVVGETVDRDGKRGYVLTFQTREQHIRRERATSNICTNQGLLCLRGAMYLSLLGAEGLRRVAEATLRKTHYARSLLAEIEGVKLVGDAPVFGEYVVRFGVSAASVYDRLARVGIGAGLPLVRYFPDRAGDMLIAVTELTAKHDIDRLAQALPSILTDLETVGKVHC